MSLLEIITYPDKSLYKPTDNVININGNTQKIIKDMEETMYYAHGIGLAANQVGIDQSLLIYDISPPDKERRLHVLINPTIVHHEGEITSEGEGCLSIPDFRSNVKRYRSITVDGFDEDGNPRRIDAEGFLSIVLQHEIDHLRGVLLIDRLSALKRSLYKKRLNKRTNVSEE